MMPKAYCSAPAPGAYIPASVVIAQP
jgi:hypothetical protein